MFENNTNTTTVSAKPMKYMTQLGVFVQSTKQHENGDKVVLNSFLKDGKAKWKESMYQGAKTKTLGFSSADQSAYVYLSEDFVKQFVEKGFIVKSTDGQFLQLDCEMLVSPKTIGIEKATLEDLGL